MEIKVQAHVAYQAGYHVVWIPKYRRKVLIDGVKEYLEKTIQTLVIDRYPDVYVLELNVRVDHVHALLEIPPKYSVSSVVGYIKGATSRAMRRHFPFLQHATHLWAEGFFMSTVGINEEVIRRYIRYQEKQESGQAKLV
jgi:putative transposase